MTNLRDILNDLANDIKEDLEGNKNNKCWDEKRDVIIDYYINKVKNVLIGE